jgi:predicted site-specific integrase-resolvase
MENEKLYKPREICEKFNITPRTLLNWSYNGKIGFTRTHSGHRRYILPTDPKGPKPTSKRRKICYCRVSTASQKEDLERQIEYFRIEYPNHEIIRDIGSGINFKRRGFNAILESGIQGDIEEVVVTHKDRLCRFGFELIERIITKQSNGEIVVLNKKETSREQELVNDLLSIITVFSSRLHGLRSHSIKRKIKEATKDQSTEKPPKEIQDIKV